MIRALLPLLIACGDSDKDKNTLPLDTGSPDVNWDCDPIAPALCGLPFPSTYYMAMDETSATGWQVNFGPTTLPANANGYQPSNTWINEKDGFSPLTPLIAFFEDATVDGVIRHDDLGAYTGSDVKTVIVDLETQDRIAHFVELDVSGEEAGRSMLLIHPVEPMEHGHRYVVGIRNLVDSAGETLAASEGFAALRDGTPTGDPRIDDRRTLYDETIFPALAAQGFDPSELQLAWDFVIASQENITGRARWMRDDVLDRVGESGPAYTITEVQVDVNETTAKRIYGEMTVPLYTVEDGPGTMLTRDADGMPYANGETQVPFTIIVPRTAVDDPRPLPLIQYGHGLLGSQDEIHASYLSEFANTYGYILFGVDWTGMKEQDAGDITLMLVNEIDRFAMIPERTHQGLIEFVSAMQMMKGAMVDDFEMQVADPADPDSTIGIIDPDRRYYYGNSQGAIIGGAYVGLSTDFERATLGVGGMPYHILLNRSADFDPFFLIFKTMHPDPLEVQLLLAMTQTLWDSGESSGYAHAVNRSPIAGTTAKDVLLQVAIGDAQVTTLGAHMMARSYGAKLIEDPARDVWGLETVASGHEGSALVEFDYGLDVPFTNTPPDDETDPHERPRRDLAGQQQMHTFFSTGVIEHFCDGPCGEY